MLQTIINYAVSSQVKSNEYSDRETVVEYIYNILTYCIDSPAVVCYANRPRISSPWISFIRAGKQICCFRKEIKEKKSLASSEFVVYFYWSLKITLFTITIVTISSDYFCLYCAMFVVCSASGASASYTTWLLNSRWLWGNTCSGKAAVEWAKPQIDLKCN